MGGKGSGGLGGQQKSKADLSPPDGLPSKPRGLGKDISHTWDALISQIQPTLLRKIDVHQLTSLAELICHSKALSQAARSNPNDPGLTRVWLGTCDQIRKLSSAFGLSPLDRSRLDIRPVQDEHDPYQELLERRKAARDASRP